MPYVPYHTISAPAILLLGYYLPCPCLHVSICLSVCVCPSVMSVCLLPSYLLSPARIYCPSHIAPPSSFKSPVPVPHLHPHPHPPSSFPNSLIPLCLFFYCNKISHFLSSLAPPSLSPSPPSYSVLEGFLLFLTGFPVVRAPFFHSA